MGAVEAASEHVAAIEEAVVPPSVARPRRPSAATAAPRLPSPPSSRPSAAAKPELTPERKQPAPPPPLPPPNAPPRGPPAHRHFHEMDVSEAGDFTVRRPFLEGGGGVVSTAHDYARFAAMLLNRGELDGVRILSSKTCDETASHGLPRPPPTSRELPSSP